MIPASFLRSKILAYAFTLLFVFLWKNEGRSQLIDYSALSKQSIHFYLDDLLNLNTPAIKFSYQHQIKNQRYLELELGYIADINRSFITVANDQKGIQGFHIGVNFQKAIPSGTLDYEQYGVGLHYSLRIRNFESWIYRNDFSYLQQIGYNQKENHFGFYLKWNQNKRFPNGFSYTFGINPGIVMEMINTDLPENSNVFNNNRSRLFQSFLLQKERGFYFRPDLFVELNIGYTLVR